MLRKPAEHCRPIAEIQIVPRYRDEVCWALTPQTPHNGRPYEAAIANDELARDRGNRGHPASIIRSRLECASCSPRSATSMPVVNDHRVVVDDIAHLALQRVLHAGDLDRSRSECLTYGPILKHVSDRSCQFLRV